MKLNKINKHILVFTSGGRVVTRKTPNGGIFMLNQAKLLSKHFQKVSFLSTGHIEFSDFFKRDYYPKIEKIDDLIIWRSYNKHWFPRRYLSYKYQKHIYTKQAISQFKKYITKHGKPDIIHAHNIVFSGIVAQKIQNIYKIPFVVTEHSSAFYMNVYSKSFLKKITRDIKDCDLISTVSPSNSEVLKKFFLKKTFILTNMVEDFFTFRNINLNSRFQFICVANLIPMKNVISVIEAFNIVSKTYDVGLTLVGKGPLRNEINDLILKLDIQSEVELIEYLPPKELSKKLSTSNCLILNSDYETFGVAVIEGLACGLPVIVSDKVGSNFFINSSNGLVIQNRNTNQLIDSMKSIIMNYNNYDRKKISEESKNRFGKQAFMKNLLKLYEFKW